jgi:hypothetical protein
MAEELGEYKITAVSVTPGYLRSETMLAHFGVTEANWRDGGAKDPMFLHSESPLFVGRCIAALAAGKRRHTWTGESMSAWEPAPRYHVTDYDGRTPPWREAFHGFIAGMPGFRKAFERGIAWQERALERLRSYLPPEAAR